MDPGDMNYTNGVEFHLIVKSNLYYFVYLEESIKLTNKNKKKR